MIKWQYKVTVRTHLEDSANGAEQELNRLGNSGWELMWMDEVRMYFKRMINPPYNPNDRGGPL